MRSVALTGSVLLALACGAQQTPTAPSSGVSVSGRVLDFGTGLGVSGATVVIAASAVTDASGAYTMTVPAGSYVPLVDGVAMGEARVRGLAYRGDFICWCRVFLETSISRRP